MLITSVNKRYLDVPIPTEFAVAASRLSPSAMVTASSMDVFNTAHKAVSAAIPDFSSAILFAAFPTATNSQVLPASAVSVATNWSKIKAAFQSTRTARPETP